MNEIAIIGAGPSGLIAAEMLSAAGCRVTVYDHMPSPARKFLIAGRGGLNLTHSEPLVTFIKRYGTAADWLTPSINAFPPDALRRWCEGLGQDTYVGSSGRVFPRSMKAVALLRAWLQRLEQLGVIYRPRHRWLGFEDDALLFQHQNETLRITPDATLLALGGASWPRLGSDGAWTSVLAACGVELAPLRPANGGFIAPWSDYFRTRFAGMPLKPLAVAFAGHTRQGEAMITAHGIEGGIIYALSAALREAIERDGVATLPLDLRPTLSLDALTQKLSAPRASKSLSTYLGKAGFSPLTIALLRELTPPEQLAHADAASLAARFKALPLTLTATTGIARAISSAGGITRAAVTEDFMLRAKPGVFAAGEMLDWEAPTGGYLLQACFSTAVSAAHGIYAIVTATTRPYNRFFDEESMAYEDPIEAALRALTDVEWRKRKNVYEARINHTHCVGIAAMLADHNIPMRSEVSAVRSGRYIATVNATDVPTVLKAVQATKAVVKPHRRKWSS